MRRCWGPISFCTSDQNLLNFIGRQSRVVCLVQENIDTVVPYCSTIYKLHIVYCFNFYRFFRSKKILMLPLKWKGFFGELLPKGRELRAPFIGFHRSTDQVLRMLSLRGGKQLLLISLKWGLLLILFAMSSGRGATSGARKARRSSGSNNNR